MCLLVSVAPLACSNSEIKTQDKDGQSTPQQELPSADFLISAMTQGVLFTWVDKDGSFAITESRDDIPDFARSTVRVVVDGHSPGGAKHVFVVDLNQKTEQEEIPVRSMSREKWEGLGKVAREKRVAELRPPEQAPDPSPASLGVDAIVYGADWCKPCHMAEDYLKKKGARVVKKDIEEDPSAGAEMRRKLKGAGMSGSSIPVLDVGGTILRGFSARAVDAALKRAKKL